MKKEKELSAHQFKDVYQNLGLRLEDLGCIMLEVEPTIELIRIGEKLKANKCLYYAKDKKLFWVEGFVGNKPHVTLLYGLLGVGEDLKPYVDTVLNGWDLKEVEVEKIGFFESPYPEENYKCIVAHVKVTPKLQEGHDRLQFLPHINTFPGYKAHFTLAYVKNEDAGIDVIKEFSALEGKKFSTKGLNYGGNKK
jgi:2'-5' RNA ligase